MKMTFLLLYTVMLTLKGITVLAAADKQHYVTECGVRPVRRQPKLTSKFRYPKIIDGVPTREGQFPWQVSLELLHPSLGFLGHWCGAVLVDQNWVLSAAHCIHNDLFNLPLPPFWTVVLGEHNRHIESGYEQRIPVEKIIMHERYENFQHDLVMLKLSVQANLSLNSNVRKICLPFIAFNYPQSVDENNVNDNDMLDYNTIPSRDDNYLRSIKLTKNGGNNNARNISRSERQTLRRTTRKRNQRRRNDKFLHGSEYFEDGLHDGFLQDLPYIDCIATGWGKSTTNGDLTDILLQTQVPIHANSRCEDAYRGSVKIHKGHLCAGKLNGKGGTCVGDSGGPLQCRLSKNGPWLLAGVTSFGSGCAEQGYPDVYTRISYYIKWITDIIAQRG